ncbi:DUF4175 family protein [Croceivirga thetidis]|uniref:DUF4175 family protein n=1 Tax=Croceivirga thetidis TaxID=2721623 RepID=UPI001B2FED32|nr:DUF4175 family protein [Croceivirga thetidis]
MSQIRKGIDNKLASVLIGKHFPEVADKLTNLLDLSESADNSDLLSASIDQKSKELGNIPFVSAISFKSNFRFLKIMVVPGLLVLVFAFAGKLPSLFQGYERVKNYDLAYTQPAPFDFVLENKSLSFLEGEEIAISLKTIGEIIPDEVLLKFNEKEYLMKSEGNRFSYGFGLGVSSGSFQFVANGYNSREFDLVVRSVPSIEDFQMHYTYPSYLGKSNEVVKGTGNGIVPEGTQIRWALKTINTEKVLFDDGNEQKELEKVNNGFELKNKIMSAIDYSIATSNNNVKDYERLNYHIEVVKDEYPSIEVIRKVDSLAPNSSFYDGLVSDDYGLRSVKLVYYRTSNPETKYNLVLAENLGNGGNFAYEFPTGLEVEEDTSYQLYFLVTDNDGLRGGKTSRSEVFDATIYGEVELREKELDSYKSVLENFEKGISKSSEQQKALEEINNTQKETEALSFNDKNKIKDFIQKQEAQEDMMKSFSKKLAQDLEKTKENSEFNELLKERLLRQEIEAEKNRKLLEELNKVADKIEKEELQKRLEELAKKQSSGKRNLEQLLELTKRYYVTEKLNQLAKDLEELSEKQDALGKRENEEGVSEKEQQELNNDYNKLDEELNELKQDNQDLRKPMDLDIDKSTQESIKEDQKEALKEVMEKDKNGERSKGEKKPNARNKMGSAAKKMKKLSDGMRQSMSMSGGGSSIAEDAEMLRQILENLITFSFKQEDLFDKVNEAGNDLNQTSFAVRNQQELRGMFEHVDDSLFALSLRQPDLSEFVNEEITEVYYNIDKALENIAENQVYQGASYQQYVLSSSNSLADYLAKMLDNMQQSMMQGQGQGQGEGFQLPDIIKAQEQLGEKMGQISGEGQGQKEGSDSSQDGQGDGGQNNKNSSEGELNKEGGQGKQGDGEDGKSESGKGNQGYSSGEGLSEQSLDEIYEIYKEQQTIREALERQLTDLISNPDNQLAKKLVRQMESFENDLLENGITKRTVNKMNTIQHELMKLENAAIEQGKKKERESNTNYNKYNAPTSSNVPDSNKELPAVEILNRQALPLQNKMSKKVQGYFEEGNKL